MIVEKKIQSKNKEKNNYIYIDTFIPPFMGIKRTEEQTDSLREIQT